MAPLTAWLPARPNQDFDLVVNIVGPGASVLLKEWAPLAQSLTHQGLSVMAQSERLNGEFDDFVLHIRLAAHPFYSMGHGCDVLVHLSDTVPEFRRFGLQPGSVLLWQPPEEQRSHPIVPEGVIAYQIPLNDLCLQHGEGLPGKGLAALGALLHLLGVSDESLRRCTPLFSAPQSFAGGVDFARHSIEKRDAYSLPLSVTEERSRMMLTPEQAILLGYAVSSCECGTTCEEELVEAPAQWIARHTGMAGAIVSVLESDRHPGVQAYRGPHGKVIALLRGDDSAIASCLNGFVTPRIFVAADIPDALGLLIAGHDLIRRGLSDGVAVLIEETLALRHQSVDLSAVQELLRRRGAGALDAVMTLQPDLPDSPLEGDGEIEAEVGFVAWGAAQGVVRDAVGLCRSFGLRVAGLYPKRIVPFPQDEVETFAHSVNRAVLVESNPAHGFGDWLRASCSLKPTALTPMPGKSLTPMDIFLREGLGAL